MSTKARNQSRQESIEAKEGKEEPDLSPKDVVCFYFLYFSIFTNIMVFFTDKIHKKA